MKVVSIPVVLQRSHPVATLFLLIVRVEICTGSESMVSSAILVDVVEYGRCETCTVRAGIVIVAFSLRQFLSILEVRRS